MDIILGVFLKSLGFAEFRPQTLALVAIGAPLFAAAMMIFSVKAGSAVRFRA